MINWFKRKSKKDKLRNSLLEWFEEKEEKRAAFMVVLDEEEGITTTGVYGSSSNIINALVNELVNDEELAALVMEAVASYCELKFPPIQAEAKPVEEKPKRRRKKTDKVVS